MLNPLNPPGELIEYEFNGYTLLLDPEDEGFSKDLLTHGEREIKYYRYLESILEPEWVCCDIGSCLGYFAFLEAKKCREVWSIEPLASNLWIQTKAASLNEFKNIKFFQLAITDENKPVEFNARPYRNLGRLIKTKAKDIGVWKTVLVPGMTFDTICLINGKYPDFVRADIESAEVEFCDGAKQWMEKASPGSILTLEIHTCHFENHEPLAKAIIKIEARGFRLERIFTKFHERELNPKQLDFWRFFAIEPSWLGVWRKEGD